MALSDLGAMQIKIPEMGSQQNQGEVSLDALPGLEDFGKSIFTKFDKTFSSGNDAFKTVQNQNNSGLGGSRLNALLNDKNNEKKLSNMMNQTSL